MIKGETLIEFSGRVGKTFVNAKAIWVVRFNFKDFFFAFNKVLFSKANMEDPSNIQTPSMLGK